MLENNNETNVKKTISLKKVILISSIAVAVIVLVIVGIVIGGNVKFYSERAEENGILRFIEKWNTQEAANPLTNGVKLSAEVGEHSYQISDDIAISYEIDKYLWVTYGTGNVELTFEELDLDVIKELTIKYVDLFGHIKDFPDRYDNAIAAGSISEERKPVRVSVGEYAVYIDCKDGFQCNFKKDGPNSNTGNTTRPISEVVGMTPEKYKENIVAMGIGTGSGVTELEAYEDKEIGAKWVFAHTHSSDVSLLVYLDDKYNVVAMMVGGNYEYGVNQISTFSLGVSSKLLSAALGYSEDQGYANVLYNIVLDGDRENYYKLQEGVIACYQKVINDYGASVERFAILVE